jgi:hypothetical protein
VIARGELKLHTHRIADEGSAQLNEDADGTLFVVAQPGRGDPSFNEEHHPIALPAGWYESSRGASTGPTDRPLTAASGAGAS